MQELIRSFFIDGNLSGRLYLHTLEEAITHGIVTATKNYTIVPTITTEMFISVRETFENLLFSF